MGTVEVRQRQCADGYRLKLFVYGTNMLSWRGSFSNNHDLRLMLNVKSVSLTLSLYSACRALFML